MILTPCSWDEWVPEQLILKLDEAGVAKQKALAQSALAAQSAGNAAASAAGKIMKEASGKGVALLSLCFNS